MVKRVFIVGWDGLRADMVGPETTPNLCRLIAEGTRFTRATAVFPSETRPNNAALGTGCQPGRHGITANYLYAPEVVPGRRLNTGDPADLLAIGQRHGRVVPPETLGERLARAGRRIAVIGSGSPGQTLLQNPHGAGWTINRAIRVPPTLDAGIEARLGRQPASDGGWAAVDAYLQRVGLEHVLPDLDPQVLVLWSCEPDATLHKHGLGSPEARAVLRTNDERLGDLLARVSLGDAALLFLSDHGHTTVRRRVDLRKEVAALGIGRAEVVAAGAGLHLLGPARDRLAEVAAWLREQPWCGPLFVRDDRWDASLAGTAPASSLWGGAPGRWVPDLQLSFAWDDEPNEWGVPGRADVAGSEEGTTRTQHGSLSPRDMGNVMVLAGAGMRRGATSDIPASTTDVAPTVLRLLGLEAEADDMDGRPLLEALDGGAAPTVVEEPLLAGRWGRLVRRRVGSATYVAALPSL